MEALTILEIAQRFNAGSIIARIHQSHWDERIVLPSRAGLFHISFGFPALKALGYCQRINSEKLKQTLPKKSKL